MIRRPRVGIIVVGQAQARQTRVEADLFATLGGLGVSDAGFGRAISVAPIGIRPQRGHLLPRRPTT
jgi:hypothetical protein